MPKLSKKPSKKKESPVETAREVLYPEIQVSIHEASKGTAATAELMKQILGWEEERAKAEGDPGVSFGSDYMLVDEAGKKIRCPNNDHNRPFDAGWAKALAQDILNRNFAPDGPNCENMIVGKTGRVISGQHRGIALILANQIWASDSQGPHWKDKWSTPPTIDTLIAYGASENPVSVRTIDNVKPRSFSDVLFTDADLFGKVKNEDRQPMTKMLDYAIKMLWDRTGEKDDAFAPRRTHSEGLEFLARHPRLKKCVQHIWTEDKPSGEKGKTVRPISSKFISPGYASALTYLFATCKSDGDQYRAADNRDEKKLDFEMYDQACEFWVYLKTDQGFAAVREARRPHSTGEFDGFIFHKGEGSGTISERIATLCKAWLTFANGDKITKGDVELIYKKDEDGEMILRDSPDVGGIDLGGKKEKEDEPSQEEIEAAKAKADRAKKADMLMRLRKAKKMQTPPKDEEQQPAETE